MSVFVELTTDAFQENFSKAVEKSQTTRRAGANTARRPLRGLEIREDTYGILKLVKADGTEIPLIDSSSSTGMSTQNTNFIIQSVQEARMEKHQIVETFGESYIFFFGEAPRFLDVQAILVDSNDFNWYAEFWENYNNYLRGTKSVELGARTYLFYDDNIVEGYMLQAQAVKTSEQPLMARLSFRLYLTNYSNVSFIGDPDFPIRSNVALPQNVDLRSTDAYAALNNIDPVAAAQKETDALNAKADALTQAAKDQRQQLLQLDHDRENMISQLPFADPFTAAAIKQRLLFLNQLNSQGEVNARILDNDASSARAQAASVIANVGSLVRLRPLRSLIADNFDEFTNQGDELLDIETSNAFANLNDVEDLHTQSMGALQQVGAKDLNHNTVNNLGLGPMFGQTGVGFGLRAGVGASFGFGAGLRAGAGLGGGLGFSGGVGTKSGFGFGPGTNFGQSTNPFFQNQQLSQGPFSDRTFARPANPLYDQLFGNSYRDVFTPTDTTTAVFSGGVQLGNGISTGTGIGGGFYGGPPPAGFNTGNNQAYFPGGANVPVTGQPTSFAMISARGTLSPNGLQTDSFNRSTF